jgi:hypothetical protein
MSSTQQDTIGQAPGARRHRSWLIFFAVLGVLAPLAIVIPLLYNLSRLQKYPVQLAENRDRWKANAPRNYDLEYLVKIDDDSRASEYVVHVRDGQVVLVGLDRDLLWLAPWTGFALGPLVQALPPRSFTPHSYTMDALFGEMERWMHEDKAGGRRNYATASFDPVDGHPLHYIHRVRGTHQRVEWIIRLRRVEEGTAQP